MPSLVAPRASAEGSQENVPSGGATSSLPGPTSPGGKRTLEACDLPWKSAPTLPQRGTPPATPRNIYLLEVGGPEQPGSPIRQAHVHNYVLHLPVAAHDPACEAPALLHPVVPLDLHSYAHACVLRLHRYQSNASGRAEKYRRQVPILPGRVRRRVPLTPLDARP